MTADIVADGIQVMYGLYAAIDAGRATTAASVFAHDAVFATARVHAEGIEAIEAFLVAREENTARRTVHIISNVRHHQRDGVLVLDGVQKVLVPSPDGQGWVVEHAGPVRHELRNDDGHWLITARSSGEWHRHEEQR